MNSNERREARSGNRFVILQPVSNPHSVTASAMPLMGGGKNVGHALPGEKRRDKGDDETLGPLGDADIRGGPHRLRPGLGV